MRDVAGIICLVLGVAALVALIVGLARPQVFTRRTMGELVPIDDARRRKMEAIAGLRRLAKGRKLNGMTIRQLIDEGRRF